MHWIYIRFKHWKIGGVKCVLINDQWGNKDKCHDIWFSLPASHKLLQSQFSVVECLTLAVKFYITILFFMSSNFTIMSDLNIYSISLYFDLNIHSIFFVPCWVDFTITPIEIFIQFSMLGRFGKIYLFLLYHSSELFGLISLIPYRTKIRRTKNSADKNFRRTKFSAPFKIFGTFVRFLLDFYIVSLDKTFGGQKFSADKNFGTSSNFRQFCPPNFCPIR